MKDRKARKAIADTTIPAAERILEVAMRMFSDRGFDGVTTRQIAREAGVTFPTMYRRFPSKRALYMAACGSVLNRMASKYARQARESGTAETRLLSFVAEQYYDLVNDPCFAKLVQREVLDQDAEGLAQLTRDYFVDQFEAVKDICRTVTKTLDVDETAFGIYATTFGYVQLMPIGSTLKLKGARWRDAHSMARLILKLVIPTIDWTLVPIRKR